MFVDLVTKLRRLGTECFLQQMTSQKNQIVDILIDVNGMYLKMTGFDSATNYVYQYSTCFQKQIEQSAKLH